MSEKSQHSREFIEEMHVRLQEEYKQLQQEIATLAHKDTQNDYPGQYEANFPEYERDSEENAMESADYGNVNATTQAVEKRLVEVEAALGRIKAGTYGVTEDGAQIPENRLRANPAATTLVTPGK